ncbi:MAG: Fic family protein [Rubrivivax sp.]|nr:Fic family protein [Rubrivivax sp.]
MSGNGTSAVGRAIARSLKLDYGWTEMRPLAWICLRGWSGWAEEATSLIQAYDDLRGVHDRLADRPDTQRNETFRRLTKEINDLAQTKVANTPEDRDDAKDKVSKLLGRAKDLEKALNEAAEQKAEIQELPKTKETARELERRANDLASSKTGMSLEVHEALFKQKTEVLEAVVGDKVAQSRNPKLAPLKGLPPEQYWRLLIDGNAQKDPPDKHCYDRSSGYMAGMMSGLELIVDRVDEKVSIDFIKDLHKAMSQHVTTETASNFAFNGSPLMSSGSGCFQEQGLKTGWNGWGTSKEGSKEGLKELAEMRERLQKVLEQGEEPVIDVPYFTKSEQEMGSVTVDVVNVGDKLEKSKIQPVVMKLMTHVLDEYERTIRNAETEDDKLDAIIDCCRGLGQIHPFKDANGRLIMFGVMAKLLLENGLPPTLLKDQGIMIGQSREELRKAIKEGQLKVNGMKTG